MLDSSVDCLVLSFYVLLYYEDFLIVGIKLVYLCYDLDNVDNVDVDSEERDRDSCLTNSPPTWPWSAPSGRVCW